MLKNLAAVLFKEEARYNDLKVASAKVLNSKIELLLSTMQP